MIVGHDLIDEIFFNNGRSIKHREWKHCLLCNRVEKKIRVL